MTRYRVEQLLPAAALTLALTVAMTVAMTVGGAAASEASGGAVAAASAKTRIKFSYRTWRSAMRHEDGETACSLMTLKFRKGLISAVAEGGVAGVGCETIIDVTGREVYQDQLKGRATSLSRIDVRRSRADARTNTGERVCFALDRGRWKLSGTQRTRPSCFS